jgi:ribonuclease P protein component
MAGNERFRPRERLQRREDYARVFARKCRLGDSILLVYAAPNGLDWSRLGLSVSKRLGPAVRRNYIRRRIREAFRRQKDVLPTGLDLVCVAAAGINRPGADVAASLRKLAGRLARILAYDADRHSPPGGEPGHHPSP